MPNYIPFLDSWFKSSSPISCLALKLGLGGKSNEKLQTDICKMYGAMSSGQEGGLLMDNMEKGGEDRTKLQEILSLVNPGQSNDFWTDVRVCPLTF